MDSFSTKNMALQAQKKLMSKMATKTMANLFIDDTSSEVLDELYRVTKEYTRNRKEAQKIIKNLIKMVVKLGVLYRNGQFNNEELALVDRFRKKVHTLAMTAVSFYQIDFTFDRRVMSNLLNDCRELLHQAINRHLTAKSHGRINHVFNHFSDCEFLATLYGPSEVYRAHLQKICEGVNKMLDDGNLWPLRVRFLFFTKLFELFLCVVLRVKELKVLFLTKLNIVNVGRLFWMYVCITLAPVCFKDQLKPFTTLLHPKFISLGVDLKKICCAALAIQ